MREASQGAFIRIKGRVIFWRSKGSNPAYLDIILPDSIAGNSQLLSAKLFARSENEDHSSLDIVIASHVGAKTKLQGIRIEQQVINGWKQAEKNFVYTVDGRIPLRESQYFTFRDQDRLFSPEGRFNIDFERRDKAPK